ncbi:relaxase/mobilization nuclease domain-containing protein [Clostridium perfringens]|uniref:relaxase/mobilization nuclease domain-containing protein n=1 Tax=Clostridium perfringens TaxID=1502 RepID=UPI0024482BA7|nr:relaxase/mobilization nuclease domain-containing protein [Clostridium perfringens]MDH2475998.1 relaxase/mobilization nuclease domain-containing protein [Clostridium perfringens]
MAVIKYLPGKKSLKSQLKYLEKEGKTLEELKTGINCTSDNVEKEFNIVKELYNKKEGKQYYHYTQAFNPEDKITPEKAHEIGKEWIEKNIKGYQIYLVTHIDKEHIHNHFIINSVSFEDGKKLQISPKKLEKMKKESNKICEREHLTEINLNKKNEVLRTDEEYRIEKRGQETWKGELREVIELELKKSKSLEEFRENLKEKYNVETRVTKSTISYKHPDQKKSVRGKRLGENYTKERIINEFNKQTDRSISKGDNRGRKEERGIEEGNRGAEKTKGRSEEYKGRPISKGGISDRIRKDDEKYKTDGIEYFERLKKDRELAARRERELRELEEERIRREKEDYRRFEESLRRDRENEREFEM